MARGTTAPRPPRRSPAGSPRPGSPTASSMIVCGRSPPSRWSWSSTLGTARSDVQAQLTRRHGGRSPPGRRRDEADRDVLRTLGEPASASTWHPLAPRAGRDDRLSPRRPSTTWIHVDVVADEDRSAARCHGYLRCRSRRTRGRLERLRPAQLRGVHVRFTDTGRSSSDRAHGVARRSPTYSSMTFPPGTGIRVGAAIS